jgi:(2S)-methylsuccinyl-CoA dehydrogenase
MDLSALLAACRETLSDAESYRGLVSDALRRRLQGSANLTSCQHETHGLAWIATYCEALRALLDWGGALGPKDCGELEQLIILTTYFEYSAQLSGGLAMSPGEWVRPDDFGIDYRTVMSGNGVRTLRAFGSPAGCRARIVELIRDNQYGQVAYGSEYLAVAAAQFRRFVADEIASEAHRWHLENAYIPLAVMRKMADLGVFGLTISEAYGGSGLGKLAMCVVSEELSRGYLGVGSLGTRSEIAAELIQTAGTEEQRSSYLPRIASGELIPTAVFTEADNGSDLANLTTRAELVPNSHGNPVWRVNGSKTWITHAARSDLMTLLVRTQLNEKGYGGLSILLAEKPRGDDSRPFPSPGLNGSEINVLGYRGMKEFEIGFDGFEVPEANLLGAVRGQGFKQLMSTFESARVQTAARAVGVAQNALELGFAYALERKQFGNAIIKFPRIFDKLAWMTAETMAARQLCYRAARRKDDGKRCDVEAGMAKLLAARVAWNNADNAVQVHGGNGFALEYPISRVLCDARILSIFEGAAEIQAQVIARGLLTRV